MLTGRRDRAVLVPMLKKAFNGAVNRSMFGVGWRLPALAVVIGLVMLVGLARAGMKEPPVAPTTLPPAVSPTAGALAVAASPSAQAPSRPDRVPVVLSTPSDLEFVYSPWPDRYADGIPRSIEGEPVLRINAALLRARLADDGQSGSLLIGGWFAGNPDGASGCSAQAYEPWCRQGRLADTAARLGRGEGVEMGNMPAIGAGPVVVSATVVASCPDRSPRSIESYCTFKLSANDLRWQGDAFTNTEPIAVGPLISAIAAVMWFDPMPFHEQPNCRLVRPPQTYTTTYGNVEAMIVFPTRDDRLAQASTVLNAPSSGTATSGCAALPPLEGLSGWVSDENVMVRVVDYDGAAGRTVRDLLDEMAASASQ